MARKRAGKKGIRKEGRASALSLYFLSGLALSPGPAEDPRGLCLPRPDMGSGGSQATDPCSWSQALCLSCGLGIQVSFP